MPRISIEKFLTGKHIDAASDKQPSFVFLGGTCNGSTWRTEIKPLLEVDAFNPVVKDWTEACKAQEEEAKRTCDMMLFVITPKQKGFFSFVELTVSAFKDPTRTVVVFLDKDDDTTFDAAATKSIAAIREFIERETTVKVFDNLADAAKRINGTMQEHIDSIRNRD